MGQSPCATTVQKRVISFQDIGLAWSDTVKGEGGCRVIQSRVGCHPEQAHVITASGVNATYGSVEEQNGNHEKSDVGYCHVEEEGEGMSDVMGMMQSMGLPCGFGKRDMAPQAAAGADHNRKYKNQSNKFRRDNAIMSHTEGSSHPEGSSEGSSHPSSGEQRQTLPTSHLERNAWIQGYDEKTQCYYYYNDTLGLSQWEEPEEGFVPLSWWSHNVEGPPLEMQIEDFTIHEEREDRKSLLGRYVTSVPRQESTGILVGGVPTSPPERRHTRFDVVEDDVESGSSRDGDVHDGNTYDGGVQHIPHEPPLPETKYSIEQGPTRTTRKKKKKKKKQRQRRLRVGIGPAGSEYIPLKKYWLQRYSLFSLYDRGIILDEESWYSVTPEVIAWHHAMMVVKAHGKGCLVLDAFAGAGGNAIQFALAGCMVLAIELSPERAAILSHNTKVYGVQDHVEVLCGDFLSIGLSIRPDVLFFSPPWGGPEYVLEDTFDVEHMGGYPHIGFSKLLDISVKTMKCSSIIMWLPRNVTESQIQHAEFFSSPHPIIDNCVTLEAAILNGRYKANTLYMGPTSHIAQ